MDWAKKAIKERISVRTYGDKPVTEEEKNKLTEYLEDFQKGPFGNAVRFQFVTGSEKDQADIRDLGAYGMIKGAALFLAGAVENGENAMEDFGYCMEAAILKATEMGLGTCWLGGYLNRSGFSQKISLRSNEVLPAVTPLGTAGKPTVKENMIRTAVRARSRKKMKEIYFDESRDHPGKTTDLGKYEDALEMVRIGPSASNKQPWRIIREKNSNAFYFFLDEDIDYNSGRLSIRIQNVDMGIAMCHFEFTAKELGLKGAWSKANPSVAAGDWSYIVSWKEM